MDNYSDFSQCARMLSSKQKHVFKSKLTKIDYIWYKNKLVEYLIKC